MIRLKPDDDYFLALHGPSTPMQIGALQLFERDGESDHGQGFVEDVVRHLRARLPATPLSRVRRSAPFHIDCDAWFERAAVELEPGRPGSAVRVECADREVTADELHGLIAGWVMEELDPERPPFRVIVIPRVEGGRSALHLTTLHALADGVGFQSIVGLLTDDAPSAAGADDSDRAATRDARIPAAPEWIVRSSAALAIEAIRRRQSRATRAAADKALADFKADARNKRAKTPKLGLSGPTSMTRSYTTLTVALATMRDIGSALGGTVNDVFLAVSAGAIRSFLLEIGDLPSDPIVVNAARSYRQAEHGELGNRIVSLHPHLATNVADPIERFTRIQASMATELERSRLQEPTMGQDASFFSAKRLRQQVSSRVGDGGSVLPGNVSLSNVPGPERPRFLAGYRMLANYPSPIIGSGRFLNITLRRYCDGLDLGIMTDAAKVPDARVIRDHVLASLNDLSELEGAHHGA